MSLPGIGESPTRLQIHMKQRKENQIIFSHLYCCKILKKIPWNFISCSICGCSGCNIALGIDCNHSDCVMIIAIEFSGINVSINAIGSDWFVWTAKSGRIWFYILK